jgi:hypothetical protein
MVIASKDGVARVPATVRNAVVSSAQEEFLSEFQQFWNRGTSFFCFQFFPDAFPRSFF